MKNGILLGFITSTFLMILSLSANILKVGHRGACGYEPENTLRSFAKAMELGVGAVELDVYRCKSGELVVFHDHRLERTTNGSGLIEEKTLTELKQLDAGNGEKIPTLVEVLDLIDKNIIINIELKGLGTALPTANLIKKYVYGLNWSWDHFLVSSFNHHELQTFKRLCPEVNIGALIEGIPLSYAAFGVELGAYAVILSHTFINQVFVDDAHQQSLKVFTYTVNHPDDIAAMKLLGVDGIISNYPDRL